MFRNQRARTTLRNRPRGNLRILWISTAILFGILIARLFEMQIIHGEEFSIKAENNRIVQTNIPGSRGLIYDRLGNPLVNNTVSFSASIVPSLLPSNEQFRYQIYLTLEKILDLPALEITMQIEKFQEIVCLNYLSFILSYI